MKVTREDIQRIAPRPTKSAAKAQIWDWYVEGFETHSEELFEEFGIDQPEELHDFMAHVLHESGGLTIVEENMNYSAPRIMEIFGVGKHSAKITAEEAKHLAGNPDALAERVYGLGNPSKARELGNIEPGDGARYRGFGAMQITGRADHEKYYAGAYDNRSVIRAALMEYTAKGCPKHAMACDILKTTKLINGGKNGFADRQRLLALAQQTWPKVDDTDDVQAPAMALALTSEAPMKKVYESNTNRGASASGVGGGFVAIEQVKVGITNARHGGGFDWFALADATVFNYLFWTGFIIIAGSLLVFRERWLKGDLSWSKKSVAVAEEVDA